MRQIAWALLPLVVGCGTTRSNTEIAAELVREGEQLALDTQTAEAIEKYREALEYQPQWTQARFDLGRLEFEKGQTHFFNHRQQKREADDARASGKFDDAKDKDVEAQKEFDIADPLLQESAKNLRKVIGSQTAPDNLLNAFVWLGTIHSFYEQYSEAKKFFDKAAAMNPKGDAMEKIRRAQQLVEDELNKQAEEQLGPRPD